MVYHHDSNGPRFECVPKAMNSNEVSTKPAQTSTAPAIVSRYPALPAGFLGADGRTLCISPLSETSPISEA